MKLPSSIRLYTLCIFASSFCCSSASAQSPAPRPITIDDYFQILSVHDPQLSPDAKWVAYSVDKAILKTDKNETRIWMVPTSGGEAIPLTAEGVSSSHPRWSSDGKFLAFLSDRNGLPKQVWLLNRLGGEAQRLTNTPQAVDDFAWSPDSRRLVLVLRDPSPEELEAAKSRSASENASSSSSSGSSGASTPKAKRPWIIDRLQFKADTIGYLDRRRTHLYVFDLASKSLTQITSGDYDDSEPAWSPDSKLLAFTSNRSTPDPDATYNTDIWTVDANNVARSAGALSIDKGAHLTQVTTNPGADNSPAWSPDGKTIAYVTMTDPKLFDYATRHLAISPAAGGPARILTLSLDRMVSSPHFSPDGRVIYFIVDDNGTQNLAGYTLDPQTGTVTLGNGKLGARPISGSLFVSSYSIGGGSAGNVDGGTIAAEVATIDRPSEIYVVPPGGKPVQLTHVNDPLFSQLLLSHGEYVHFKSHDGTPVSGYLYKPLDYTPGHRYPTLLIPHGGPVWAYYAEFSHLAQLYAANGYAVLFPNPRGSSGYGQDFCKAIYADWGDKDFQDDMAMVDYAIAQGIADPDKLGVGGWSYGGISTDFIITQTTRFKAAISGAGAAEFISLYGHDEYQRDYETELGLPWQSPEVWQHVSSYRNITKVTAPTLFLGGNIDWNVPILGGEQMYQSLKRLGVPTELVVYPDEYHEFTLPSHLKDRLQRDLAWYAHYVKADGTPARPA
ncbi:MAG TPA: S9 family peptidase, partial [Candidatus Methylomirabilis sp.]|nr:S9 family peptidase [Candidatus Methylomirabilis sp.]